MILYLVCYIVDIRQERRMTASDMSDCFKFDIHVSTIYTQKLVSRSQTLYLTTNVACRFGNNNQRELA